MLWAFGQVQRVSPLPHRARSPDGKRGKRGNIFVQEILFLRVLALAVAMPILANDLLSGVTDR